MNFQDHRPVNVKPANHLSTSMRRLGCWGTLLAAGTMVQNHAGAVPTILANPAPQQPLAAQWQMDQPNEMDVFLPAGQGADDTLPQVFRYGPLALRPHLDYRFMYGTGVQNAPGSQQDTAIQEFSPGILMDLGTHWVLNYTPTFRFYSSDKFQDDVDHNVALSGGFQYEGWKFGVGHTTQITSAPTVETGGQTDQSTHSTTFSAAHAISSAMSVDLGLSQQINLVSGLQDSYDWSTMDWLNYEFWPRLNAGIGVGGGYVLVDGNSQTTGANSGNMNQTYEDLQARVNWRATDKISFQINGGLEDRQFMTAGTGDSLDPIFGVAIQYQAFEYTQISLNANRSVSSSDYYLAAQQTETTTLGVNIDQRVLRKFHLGVGIAYSYTDYNTASGAASANAVNRSDNTVSFNARLSHPFYKRGTWSLFYEYSDNTSSQAGFGFQSNQVGFEVSYSY